MLTYPITNPMFFIYAFYFLLTYFVSIFLPGLVLCSFLPKKSRIVTFLLANALGIVFFGFQGYIFGFLQIRWMTYFYLVFFSLYSLFRFRTILQPFFGTVSSKKIDIFALIFIICGSFIQLIFVFFSGMYYAPGFGFFGINAHDGILHLSFIQQIINHFPPYQPGADGLYITNYHYWSDLVMAELARIWHIPLMPMFFQYFPPILSILTGVVVYSVVRVWGGSRIVGYFSLFFLYCGSDAAYLFTLWLHKNWGQYVPELDNGPTQLLNIPTVFAKFLFLVSFIPLYFWIVKKEKKWAVITVLLAASLVGFKIYFGMFFALGFIFLLLGKTIVQLYKEKNINLLIKKEQFSFVIIFLFFLVCAVIFLPVNTSSGGLFFAPLEWPRIFLSKGSIDWNDWWLRRQVYEAHNNTRNLFILDIISFIVAIFSIYGTRIFGFFPSKELRKILHWELLLFFLPPLFIFQLLGFFTLQVSGGTVVYYFFVVSCTILSLFTSFLLAGWVKKNICFKLLVVCIILLTLPRTILDISVIFDNYKTGNTVTYISNNELKALSFLRQKTPSDAIVQSHPANEFDRQAPYVAFFTNRRSYLSAVHILEIHNQPIKQRKKSLAILFKQTKERKFAQKMKELHITYVYLQKNNRKQYLHFPLMDKFVKQVFENDSIIILQRK